MSRSALVPILALALASATPAFAKETSAKQNSVEITVSLDPLLEIPACWDIGTDDFEKLFTKDDKALFSWLTSDRTRAMFAPRRYRNATILLDVFGGEVPVEEAVVDFADGKLNVVTLSLHNRGDGGEISGEDFEARFTAAGKAMGAALQAKPRRREANPNAGLLTEGYSWFSPRGIALLEHNEGAMKSSTREYLRLRLARPGATGHLAAAMNNSRGGAAVRLGDLQKNVVREDGGDVFIGGLPMVDQGDKGYCVVASTQRAFEYYGIGADMHQLAEIAESDPDEGTNSLLMAKQLDRIDYRFKTRLEIIGMGAQGGLTTVDEKRGEYYIGDPVDERKFLKEVRSYVDSGLPLLWALELGRYPERPQLNPQTAGGHMRMIIGYNDETEEIIFSDSWGAGHEKKRMKGSHAYAATHGLFVLKPTVR